MFIQYGHVFICAAIHTGYHKNCNTCRFRVLYEKSIAISNGQIHGSRRRKICVLIFTRSIHGREEDGGVDKS